MAVIFYMWINIITFLIYSYLGATLEHLSYYFSNRKKLLANPIITGFPIYGLGAHLIIYLHEWLNQYTTHQLAHFMAYGAIASIFEYMIGWWVGAGRQSRDRQGNVVSWDYTNEPYNLHGLASLRHFVSWGLLGLVLVRVHQQLVMFLHGCQLI